MHWNYLKLRDWISLNTLDWSLLSANPNAIKLLEANLDKVSWDALSRNPNAIRILEANPENIIWDSLSMNSNAIHLLEKNQDKIYWDYLLSYNTAIFTYDYELIKNKNKELNEEIIIKAIHPKRMLRLMQEYGEDEVYKCYFDEE